MEILEKILDRLTGSLAGVVYRQIVAPKGMIMPSVSIGSKYKDAIYRLCISRWLGFLADAFAHEFPRYLSKVALAALILSLVYWIAGVFLSSVAVSIWTDVILKAKLK